MIEKAFVSGQIAQAIFKEDDKLFLIKAKDTGNIMECTPYEESLFFNSDTEIKVFGNIEIDELRKTLVKEKSNFDALYGAVGGFDRNLSEKTRILSIQRAESLVKNTEIFDFVIFRLFGNPVPKDAILEEAMILSRQNGYWEMNFVYKNLFYNGDVIDSILSIFKDTILELSLEKEYVMIKNIFTTSGIFTKLFLNIIAKDQEDSNKIVNEFSDNDHIKEKIPSISRILMLMKIKIYSKFKEDKIQDYVAYEIDEALKAKKKELDQKEGLTWYCFKKEKIDEYDYEKKGVSFIKMKDPHYENKKGETHRPTKSKPKK